MKVIPIRGTTKPEVKPFDKYGDVLAVADVSGELGISQKVVREYCAAGKLPGVKIGSRWVIPKRRLIEALGMAGEVA